MKKTIGIIFTFVLMLCLLTGMNVSAEELTVPQDGHPQEIVIDNVRYVRGTKEYNIIYGDGETVTYTGPADYYVVEDFIYNEDDVESITEINVVSDIEGLPVTKISTNSYDSFAGGFAPSNTATYPNVKSINLPSGIEAVYECAFTYFPNVEELEFTSSLKEIGYGAFGNMKKLKRLGNVSNVTYAEEYSFYNCESLVYLTFTDKLNYIGAHAFENTTALKSVTLPEKIESIGSAAFKNSGLETVTVPATDSMGNSVFNGCKKLKTVVFCGSADDTYLSVPTYSFYNCYSLTEVYFPEICERILLGRKAFMNCEYLKSLYFNSLTATIDIAHTNVFKNCIRLKNVYYAASEKRWNTFVKDDSVEEKIFKYLDVYFCYNHTHSFQKEGEDATCTSDSTITFTCSCGHSYTSTYKKNNNHKYGEWKTVKKPTASEYGKKERKCSRCGKVATKKIEKLIKISGLKAYVNNTTYADGKELKPKVRVYKKDGSELNKGVHYKLTYKNNINCTNKATVTIKGISKNGYTGSKTLTFSIKPRAPRYDYYPENITDKTIKISWNKIPEADGYRVYVQEVGSEDKVVSLKTKKTVYTLKKLKPATSYYVAVTSYVEADDGQLLENHFSFNILSTRKESYVAKFLPEEQHRVVIDNVVYCFAEERGNKLGEDGIMNEYESGYGDHYYVEDFFDDEEKAKAQKSINIVSEVNGLPVTEIQTNDGGSYGGYDPENYETYPNITKITLPESIEYISNYSFIYFPNVKALALPESLEKIGSAAFSYMSGLKSITIPSRITEIPTYAFMNCTSLKKVVFKGEVKRILSNAFKNCQSLASINLPEEMEEIGSSAFSNTGFKSFTIPVVTERELGNAAFLNCKKLKNVVVSGNKKNTVVISFKCFYGCTNLKSVELPAENKKVLISKSAFSGCEKLSEIKNISQICSISKFAFRNCKALTSFYIGEKVKAVGSLAFENCTSLSEVTFSNSVDVIYAKVFKNCTSLKTITLESKNKVLDFWKNSLRGAPSGIKFVTQNDKVAKLLKAELEDGTKVKKAKIYSGEKLLYKNVKG